MATDINIPTVATNDIILLFLVGIAGAGIYLFVLILQGNMNMLSGKPLHPLAVAGIFLFIGGLVTFVYTVSLEGEETNLLKLLAVGFGWQGVLLGIVSVKNTEKASHLEEQVKQMKAQIDGFIKTSPGG
jgi:hypothetical protein